ncbi:hypothetical protein [Legionella tunisiensis]|uniref:hypothetical protein n=1 Tax=Legionella tunisiensis TaxID=1034944 RepID=UPI0002ECBC37|nr:hypothetical protein [Legionella tunisiensis]
MVNEANNQLPALLCMAGKTIALSRIGVKEETALKKQLRLRPNYNSKPHAANKLTNKITV